MMTGFPRFLFTPRPPPRPLPPPSKSLSRRLSIEGEGDWLVDFGHFQRLVGLIRPSLVLFTTYCKQCLDKKKLSLFSALPLKCILRTFVFWNQKFAPTPHQLIAYYDIKVRQMDFRYKKLMFACFSTFEMN